METFQLIKNKAFKVAEGFLVKANEISFVLISEKGEFIRWSSIDEWKEISKMGSEEYAVTCRVKPDAMDISVITLYSGSYNEGKENSREVTIQEIFSLNEGEEVLYKITKDKKLSWWSKFKITKVLDENERIVEEIMYRANSKGKVNKSNRFYFVRRDGLIFYNYNPKE